MGRRADVQRELREKGAQTSWHLLRLPGRAGLAEGACPPPYNPIAQRGGGVHHHFELEGDWQTRQKAEDVEGENHSAVKYLDLVELVIKQSIETAVEVTSNNQNQIQGFSDHPSSLGDPERMFQIKL